MGQPISDAAFELRGACVHSLRFAFGAPLDYPYATAPLATDNPPPALFRRVQAVSPPPGRDGMPWRTGLTCDGVPFDPDGPRERLARVRCEQDIRSLDGPEPDKIVLDQWFSVPRNRRTMSFPGPDEGAYLLSVPYWSPAPAAGEATTKQVEYFATHRLEWASRPADDWVAVSFEAFWPPERDSAEVIIPLGACDDLCPAA